jgi:hypothetical protein
MSEEIRIAQELHDRSLQHLQFARHLAQNRRANSINSWNSLLSSKSAPGKLGGFDCARFGVSTLPSCIATSLPSHAAGGSTSTTTKAEKKKKPRRKWLPPLGPPSYVSPLAGLKKGSGVGTTKGTSNNNPATSADWAHTNPEAFAALTEDKSKKEEAIAKPTCA